MEEEIVISIGKVREALSAVLSAEEHERAEIALDALLARETVAKPLQRLLQRRRQFGRSAMPYIHVVDMVAAVVTIYEVVK